MVPEVASDKASFMAQANGSVFSFSLSYILNLIILKRGRTLQMFGTDTTSSNARRPLENTRNQSMS